MNAKPEAELIRSVEGAVAWITLNRPHTGNAITRSLSGDIIERLEEANHSPRIRSVVITATGTHFCTGADLKAPPQPEMPPGAPARPAGFTSRVARSGVQRLINAVLDCELPVVAAVNGTAAGVGMHLAIACDFVVAADSARFIEVFVRRGLVPDGAGTWLLPRLIGLQRAKELMFLGADVSAERAETIGIVNSVVPADDLIGTARDLAERLANGPSRALTLTKRLLNRSFESDRVSALEDEAMAVELARSTADADEGIRSFLERRPSQFHGW